MDNNIAVGVEENIFCGECINFENTKNKEQLILKQSANSNIRMLIPLESVKFLVTLSGTHITEREKIRDYLNECVKCVEEENGEYIHM